MPSVVYITPGGQEVALDVPAGTSLMRAACDNGVEGIEAECGGTLSCATCHVFVEPAFAALLPPMSPQEEQMLEFTATPRGEHSRLSCRIVMEDALSGIRVRVAERQV